MASAIRFVGNHDVTSEGKFLWEILCQLRRFGIGRIVTKNEWARKWPEQPSFLKVVQVQPAMDRWLFGGKVWGEYTFRGRNLGIYEFSQDLNRSDWRLIHRHEELQYSQCKQPMQDITLPNSFPVPPLQVLLTKKACDKTGQKFDESMTRAPLSLCLDPEFAMLTQFIKQESSSKIGSSIYEEVNPEQLLDLYGKELPVKVEAWNAGPAKFTPRFSATEMKVQEQSSSNV